MQTNGGTLSSLLTLEASLALHGADDDANQDGKSGGDNQDQQDNKSGGSDPKENQDGKDGKGGAADKVELTDPNDIRAWNNFKEERDRLHGARRQAEQERDAAIKERDDLKAKGATDDDAKQQMTALTTERDALLTTVSNLRIENAFLSTPGYDWVDPDAALRLADLANVDVDKDGKVVKSSLKAALDALVKDKPYLLKAKSEDDQDDKDKDGPRKSGDPAPKSRQTNNDKDKQAREQTLRAKYPALRR